MSQCHLFVVESALAAIHPSLLNKFDEYIESFIRLRFTKWRSGKAC